MTFQFQRSNRLDPMPDEFQRDGKTFKLVLKGGGPNMERKIFNWKYDHRGTETKTFDPDARGFFYLYAVTS